MFASLFNREKDKSDCEVICEKLRERAIHIANDVVDKFTPELENKILDGVDFLIENGNKPDITLDDLTEYVTRLLGSPEENTEDKEEVVQFRDRIEKSRAYARICGDSTLRCIVLGNTQVGKSSTIKRLFSIPSDVLTIKDGTKSDTSTFSEYFIEVNNSKLVFVDGPGFLDSEDMNGKLDEDPNIQGLVDYILASDEIHILFLFFKISDIADKMHKRLIEKLGEKLGKQIWKKTIIILTHANDKPPEQYFYVDSDYDPFEDEPDYTEKEAWKMYLGAKTDMWNACFDGVTIPVVPVENNTFNCARKNGDLLLLDGKPMWENFIATLLKMVTKSKMPILFNLVAGESKPPKKKKGEEVDAVGTPMISLTSKQKIANAAATNVEESSGWLSSKCTLY